MVILEEVIWFSILTMYNVEGILTVTDATCRGEILNLK